MHAGGPAEPPPQGIQVRVHVLGSAAGGGFPQWNCNCPNCDACRKGNANFHPRTQSSLVASADDHNWVLFNASPDILAQIKAFPTLQPARALRDTAIRAVLLMDAQIDHTTGLYMLREHRQPLELWCHALVREDLMRGNPVLQVLQHYCGVHWHEVPLGGAGFGMDTLPGLRFEALPLLSNAPPIRPTATARRPVTTWASP